MNLLQGLAHCCVTCRNWTVAQWRYTKHFSTPAIAINSKFWDKNAHSILTWQQEHSGQECACLDTCCAISCSATSHGSQAIYRHWNLLWMETKCRMWLGYRAEQEIFEFCLAHKAADKLQPELGSLCWFCPALGSKAAFLCYTIKWSFLVTVLRNALLNFIYILYILCDNGVQQL